jgi:two-component system cell cycle response regulator
MKHKILTVDDSKTVRMIVRKVFRPYDCEIFEACTGVEGLAAAAKVQPALILLDVTMPEMDGVEMLTRLRADPQLKGIPVIMLTAEGGRDNVISIAKIGIKGYIVKPFKEEAMIEKVGTVLDLKAAEPAAAKGRTILDRLEILVVDDKPAIIQQIEEGVRHRPWRITGAATQEAALDICSRSAPDLIVISYSLPNESAVALVRNLRAGIKTKFTPIFAMVIKTDTSAQTQAQQCGFTAVLTKPVDVADFEAKAIKAMNLDTSVNYYRTEGDILVLALPENCSAADVADASSFLGAKLAGAVEAGHSKVVIDLHAAPSAGMGVIKLLVEATQKCRDLAMRAAIVGNDALIAECRSFEDARAWNFHATLDEARASLAAPVQAPVQMTAG